jgi:hypothetical protein
MRRGTLVIVGCALLLAACGGSSAKQEERCLDVPLGIVGAIAAGIDFTTSAEPRGAQAVKSGDFETVWFVAADLEGPGLDGEGDIGVWATNNIELAGMGTIMAVNEVAQDFTDWPDADSTDAAITMSADGAEEARDCVKGAL